MSQPVTQERRATAVTADQTGHAEDLYTWVQEQVALLRAGQVGALDLTNLAEELQDVGAEQYDKLESFVTVVLTHMLKWDHQPERRSRSWDNSIAEHRNRIHAVLRRNPGLKSRIGECCVDAYQRARLRASTETRLDKTVFPTALPYTWTDILERPFDIAAPDQGRP